MVQDVPTFNINFRQKRLKLAIIKSMRSNKIHNRHRNFHNMDKVQSFPQSDCWRMTQWRYKQNLEFYLSISRLFLPIKRVYLPVILGAPSVFIPSISWARARAHTHTHTHTHTNVPAIFDIVPCRRLRLATSSTTSKRVCYATNDNN